MFEAYELIFNRRGEAYHQAMRLVPGARQREFAHAIDPLRLEFGAVVCDAPSGGGYLADHLPAALDIRLIAVDPSQVFARIWQDRRVEWHLAPLNQLPLEDSSVDAFVSIAGMHHVDDRGVVFGEMRRVLRPGGRLCILEVPVGAITDQFLNGFVHTYNSTGHEGRFVDGNFRADLAAAGFRVETDELCRYTWDFSREDQMIEFIKLMFWLDKATPEIIFRGVKDILGLSSESGRCEMNWELQRIVAA